ncbi:MAG: SH3 domain-containing protein [Acidimicrobiales bacterium]
MRGTSTRVVIVLALLASVFAGCGSEGNQSATTSTAATTILPDDSSTTTSDTTTGDTTSTTTGTTVPETTGTTGQPTTSLPGTEVEMFARPGDVLGVVGVAHDDVLNIRSGPGVGFEIMATLNPTDEAVATGRARQVPGAFWYQVEVDEGIGWANMRFLAYLGGVDDATSHIVAEFDGEIPAAETMLELGRVVAEAYPRDDTVEPTITMIASPTVGDLGEVTYDVIGLADDSVVGVRLHVFGQPTEGGEGFALSTVERTTLCGRGLAGELCV